MQLRIGILGGSFDPVHFGHIHLALSLFERHHLDKVWWIPVRQSPLKNAPSVNGEHRFEMVKRGIEEIPSFEGLEIEMEKEGASFTVETLRVLKERYPKIAFHLLLGDDALYHFDKWKCPEEIIEMAPPLIGARQSSSFPSSLPLKKSLVGALRKGWTSIPLMEISATEIRKRLKDNLFCGHLVPAKVLDYIHTYHLYFPT